LKNIIVEAPEGFWLGSFSLSPVYAEEIVDQPKAKSDEKEARKDEENSQDEAVKQYGEWKTLTPPPAKESVGEVDPKQWALTSEGVLGDLADLSAVFGGEPEFWTNRKKGLKVAFSKFLRFIQIRKPGLTLRFRNKQRRLLLFRCTNMYSRFAMYSSQTCRLSLRPHVPTTQLVSQSLPVFPFTPRFGVSSQLLPNRMLGMRMKPMRVSSFPFANLYGKLN